LSRCITQESETIEPVPNQPKTPVRTFRLADDLWRKLKDSAKREGVTVSDLLRRLVDDHVKGKK